MGTLNATTPIRRITYQTLNREVSYHVGLKLQASRKTITDITLDQNVLQQSSLPFLMYHIWTQNDGENVSKVWKTIILSNTAEIEYDTTNF